MQGTLAWPRRAEIWREGNQEGVDTYEAALGWDCALKAQGRPAVP